MLLTTTPFAAIRQKSVCHAKYLKISRTCLDLLYRLSRRIGGDDYPDIRLAVAQGTLLWQPAKLGDVRRRRQKRPLLFALAFDNGFDDREAAFKRLNGNNPATSCTNLVNFCPIILEFTLLKCTILPRLGRNLTIDLHWSLCLIPKRIEMSQF